jgi:Rod binding domain-containing protein
MSTVSDIPQAMPGGVGGSLLAQKAKMFEGGKARFAPKVNQQSQLPQAKKYEMESVARSFESLFIHMMYKQMKSSMLSEDSNSKMYFGKDTLEGYSDMAFADELSKSGNGIGIAEKVYEFLTGENYLPSVVTQAIEGSSISNYQKTAIPTKVNTPTPPVPAKAISPVSDKVAGYDDIINEAASKLGVPATLIRSVIAAESSGRHDAVSPAGAKGLMQLMDGTAMEMGVNNPFDPRENINGGAGYLKKMIEQYGGDIDLALAAYNAGPGNVDKYGGIPPFPETQAYLAKVKKYQQKFGLEMLGGTGMEE